MTNFTSPYLEPTTPAPVSTSPVPVSPSVPESLPKKSYKIVALILIPFLAILAMISLYVMTQARTMYKEVSATPTPIPSPIASADPTADWKAISNKYWTFKVPAGLNSLECSTHDQILIGSPDLPSHMFDKDKIIECNFDQAGELVYVMHGLDNSENTILVPENIDPKIDPVVSEVRAIKVDGKDAIFQKETTSMGQGTGSRYKVYIHDGKYMNVITYNDISNKNEFDQILSTFKFIQSQSKNSAIEKAITEATYAYSKDHGVTSKDQIHITISKIDGDYATGITSFDASVEGSGSVWFAALHDGKWTQVWVGQEPPSCEMMTEWKFPKDIFECAK